MKIRRNVFLVLGCLFAAFNIISHIAIALRPSPETEIPLEYKGDTAYILGHYLGANLFFIIGFIFLYIAFRTNKKIRRKKRQELMDSF